MGSLLQRKKGTEEKTTSADFSAYISVENGVVLGWQEAERRLDLQTCLKRERF